MFTGISAIRLFAFGRIVKFVTVLQRLERETMHWIDWAMVVIPLVIILWIGLKVQRYTHGVVGFLAAGRKAGRYLLTVADGTAGMGLVTVVGSFEMSYCSGFALGFWNNLGIVVGLFMTLTGFVTYRYRETRVMTMAEFYEIRYNRKFRIFAGALAFVSGLLNYALFPAVSARFLIYYCRLPHDFTIGPICFNTFGFIMAIFLGIALFIVLTGGQLTTMVTDCCQGVFAYLGYAVIVTCILLFFSISDIREAALARPDGQSFFNPFNVDKLQDFNLLYVLIGIFSMIYNRNAWLGSQGYLCSAANPHEQKMAGVLGQWRTGFTSLAIMLLALGAYAYMNSASFAPQAEQVREELVSMVNEEFPVTELSTREEANTLLNTKETIYNQMLVPVAVRHILPIGATGIFLALALFLMISTDTTYLHSWGTILIQDVFLPSYGKPVSPKTQMALLRCGIFSVAVFAWFFSFYFSQNDYIYQFFALTGTVYLGGAGACMIGGLYWKRGTTAGAFAAMGVGLFFAVLGFLVNQKWGDIYQAWDARAPEQLERFRMMLLSLGELLPFANWNVEPEIFMRKFPITGQEIYLAGMISAISAYVTISLLTCRKPFNLDKMLHRGKYNLEHFVAKDAEIPAAGISRPGRFNWRILLGITPEYSKGDRILAWSVFGWTIYNFLFFLVQAVWNVPETWRWSEKTWVNLWAYYTLPLSILVGLVTTVWFSWGTIRDLIRLFRALKEERSPGQMEEEDNGLNLQP